MAFIRIIRSGHFLLSILSIVSLKAFVYATITVMIGVSINRVRVANTG